MIEAKVEGRSTWAALVAIDRSSCLLLACSIDRNVVRMLHVGWERFCQHRCGKSPLVDVESLIMLLFLVGFKFVADNHVLRHCTLGHMGRLRRSVSCMICDPRRAWSRRRGGIETLNHAHSD